MTEQIDLDDLDTGDEQDGEETPNRGDWFWKGEGDPDDEPGAPSWRESGGADEGGDGTPDGAETDADADADTADAADASATDAGDAAAGDDAATGDDRTPASPHVPSDNAGTPAGIPVERGGGGAGEASSAGTAADASADETGRAEGGETRASGPHGGGTDDMTTAFTYRAAKRLADPAAAFAEAEQWSDWIGIVGDVEAHVLGSFQRNETIDADFFNGSGTGPAERLAGIGPHSMFYADRMVVVGVAGEDEAIAEEAGWEFVSLEEAASGAGWELLPTDDAAGIDGEETDTDASADADADTESDADGSDGVDADR